MSLYQSDSAAALQLSADERLTAQQLKADRPEVYPGTRAILDRAKALIWFDKVTAAIKSYGLDRGDPNKVTAFCDLAGVPD